ncbi:FG-GAP-like repeat-containing protein [Catellatospora tritici]|uniref:FG-GAP-like repeat-containing protein n=1 Tax=Catellatospora tritici TaxID=2851566 RepID=UPI001C2D7059|nr:FG-GAP-like repeat-containing protein [Catellatospora tritici]MBV1854120.1 VCBS repeat-containing protein [Catellatospora tritici]
MRSLHIGVPRRSRWLSAALPLVLATLGVAATGNPVSAAGQPAAKPAQPARPTDAMAVAATKARSTGRAVEVTALTTQTSRTLADPDGTTTLELNAQPARVLRDGAWVGLDASLVRNADGTWSPKATVSNLTLSGGGSAPFAKMTNEDSSLAMSWPGTLPEPTVSGATATYHDVLTGVDLAVTANVGGGFSHVLVVHDAAAGARVSSLRLPITADGVTVSADTAGNITAVDKAGHLRFSAPTPTMWDSATTADLTGTDRTNADKAVTAGVAPARSGVREPGAAARVDRLAVTAKQDAITLTPPAAALTGANVHYPLYLDPTWNSEPVNKNAWTYVNSYYHDTEYWNSSDWARVGFQGWDTPNFKARSFFRFAIPSKIWSQQIYSATLETKEVWSATSASFDVDLNHISNSSAAISSGTNWDNQPAKGNLISTKTVPGDWNAAGTENPMQVDFNMTSEIVSAAAGRWSYTVVGLYNQTETNRDAWRKFENNPKLVIKYNSKPSTPSNYLTQPYTACTATPDSVVGNTSVTFNAKVSDADGTLNPLVTTFTITDVTAEPDVVTTVTQSVGSGSTATITEPSSFFVDGHTYTWSVRTNDGFIDSDSTPTCRFAVQKTAPGAPNVSASFPSGPNAGTTATFTFSAGGGGTPATYVWGLNMFPPVTTTGPVMPQNNWGTVTAGTPSVTVPLNRIGPNTLYVYAIDAAKNTSALQTYQFFAGPRSTPDPYSDFTGDGRADVLLVGDAANPGLWLYPSTDKAGHVTTTGIQVGGVGTAFQGGTGTTGDWVGSSVSPGDFNGDGAQDILVRLPNANISGSNTEIILGTGDGTPFDTRDANRVISVNLPNTDDQNFNYQTVAQVVATPDNQFDGVGLGVPYLKDLYAVVGDNLYLYPPSGLAAGDVDVPVLISSGWTGKTITAAVCQTGCPTFYARTDTSGALARWAGTTFNSSTGEQGIPAGHATSTSYSLSTSGYPAGSAPVVVGADIDVDGRPDMWRTTGANALQAYLYSTDTSFATAVSNPVLAQGPTLVGDWEFGEQTGSIGNDSSMYRRKATLSGSATFVTTGHNAEDGGAVHLNGTAGAATVTTPILRTDRSFTVGAWVKPATTTGYMAILGQVGTTNSGALLQFVPGSGWALTNHLTDTVSPTTSRVTSGMAYVSTTSWQYVVGQYDATAHTMALFVNGAKVGQINSTVSWNAGGNFLIGHEHFGNAEISNFNGDIDNIQVYQGLLPANQIRVQYSHNAVNRDYDADGNTDIFARHATTNDMWLYKSNGAGSFRFAEQNVAWPNWWMYDITVPVSDFDGDGLPDLLARKPSTGELWLYRGNGVGGFKASQQIVIATGWNAFDAITGAGDLDEDGYPDVLARNATTKDVWVYLGNGAGGFKTGQQYVAASGWGGFDMIVAPGDFDEDGHLDLIVRNSTTKDLWLYPGDGTGRLKTGAQTKIATDWSSYNAVIGTGDFDEDGHVDLVARKAANGDMWWHKGNGNGGLKTGQEVMVWSGWSFFNQVF